METRILIPNGLRIIAIDTERKSKDSTSKPTTLETEEDNEEKPSSSSGHCETSDDQKRNQLQQSRSKKHLSSCDEDGSKSWKKQFRGQLTSSSSSSSLSPTCTDSSSSSSSENEAEIEYFMKNCRKSENLIGSTSNPFELKKVANKHNNAEKDDEDMKKEKEEKTNDNQSHVKICAARVIEKGTMFTPNDGDVQIVYLKEIPAIPKDDIRYIFGCFETVTPISISPPPPHSSSSGSDPLISPASTTSTTTANSPPLDEKNYTSGKGCNFVRLCNWIRFLRRSGTTLRSNPCSSKPPQNLLKLGSDSEDDESDKKKHRPNNMDTNQRRSIGSHCPNFNIDSSKISFMTTATNSSGEVGKSNNVIARFIDGRPVFEVTERLVPGTELVAHFDTDSILNHASNTFPYMTKMMSNPQTMTTTSEATAATTPLPPVNSSPSPPAPFSFSTRISSSSPGGDSVKKDRDEKDLISQQYHQRQQLPVFHYFPVGSNASFNHSQDGNPSPLWQGNFNDNMRFSRKDKGDERKKRKSSFLQEGVAEGPLDLSKFPVFRKSLKTHMNEPLKVGTPFDSPDSNDDDMIKSIPSSVTGSDSGASSLFSIRNVLKHQGSRTPSKLFQPYSLDVGHKSAEREALMKALVSQNSSNITGPLVTPPSSSDDPFTVRNSTGLRPILRTRGRERSLLPCEVCGKAFDRPSLLKRHLRTHTGEKPHICDVCTKGFSTSSSLNTHRRIHSGEKPHQCPICGKRFTASSNLYYHRMTHNKEKPHKCMLCGKSFPTPGDLKSHQYVHSGSWPYTCSVCHRGFSKQTNLRNHLLLHTGTTSNASSDKLGDKPHTCQICDKKFAQACNLRAHIKTHEESDSATSSSCCICKRTFLLSSDMLINGRCRNCLLSLSSNKNNDVYGRSQRESTSTSPSATPSCINTTAATTAVGKTKEGFASAYDVPSLLSHKIASSIGNANQQPLAPSVGQLGFPLTQFPGFSIPGLSSALSFPSNAGGVHFPINGSHAGSNAADFFVNAAAGATPPARNALLEQLVDWNYRMAKESVGIGSLGFSIMQQKLLESRMLAAQLMTSHGFGMNGGMQDILGLRSAMASEGFSTMDPVVQGESKFMPR